MSEETRVRVALPLPLDVAATLTKLIGTAYPAARMEGHDRDMTFIIPAKARPKAVSKRNAEPVPNENDATLKMFDTTDGTADIAIGSVEDLAALCLDIVKNTFKEHPDAKNYLEQRLRDPEDNKRYVITFQRADGHTPAELRAEAEEKIAAALDMHRKTHLFGEDVCGTCHASDNIPEEWPCETARALGATA